MPRFDAVLKDSRRLVVRYQPSRARVAQILAAVQAAGLEIVDLSTLEADLEDIFLQLTRGRRCNEAPVGAQGFAMSGALASVFAACALLVLPLLLLACAPRLQPLGPPSLIPPDRRQSADDERRRRPCRCATGGRRASPRPWCWPLHGFNDYSNAFEGPAQDWAKDGIETYAYDQRGFGETPYRGLLGRRPAA